MNFQILFKFSVQILLESRMLICSCCQMLGGFGGAGLWGIPQDALPILISSFAVPPGHDLSSCPIFHRSFWVAVFLGQLLGGVEQNFYFSYFSCLFSCFSWSINIFPLIRSDALLDPVVSLQYSSCALDFSALVLLELAAAFFSFLSLIRLSVSAEIYSLW